jgi:guanylate kinase
MLVRKLEALERRLTKMMAKDENAKKRFEPAYKHIKDALDAANEDNHQDALTSMTKFNSIMNEFKLLQNV